jgi:hypothetical protein
MHSPQVKSPSSPWKTDFVSLPPICSSDTPSGRWYVTPAGNRYPSVTTFLSRFSDNSWLDSWRSRVGEEQVARVSTQAKRRGTSVHGILEKIILGDRFYSRGEMPNNLQMAEGMANALRARARIIKGVEIGLWSDKLQIAGRADCLGTFDRLMSIIDFKTSKYPKKIEDIEGYFLQTTLYALMVEELLGLYVPQLVVMIGVDFEDPQIFIQRKAQYVSKIMDLIAQAK